MFNLSASAHPHPLPPTFALFLHLSVAMSPPNKISGKLVRDIFFIRYNAQSNLWTWRCGKTHMVIGFRYTNFEAYVREAHTIKKTDAMNRHKEEKIAPACVLTASGNLRSFCGNQTQSKSTGGFPWCAIIFSRSINAPKKNVTCTLSMLHSRWTAVRSNCPNWQHCLKDNYPTWSLRALRLCWIGGTHQALTNWLSLQFFHLLTLLVSNRCCLVSACEVEDDQSAAQLWPFLI